MSALPSLPMSLLQKPKEANDLMNKALNQSIDSITMYAINEADDCGSVTEPDEFVPTRKLKIGDKIEVYSPLDYQYFPGSVPKHAEGTEKIE